MIKVTSVGDLLYVGRLGKETKMSERVVPAPVETPTSPTRKAADDPNQILQLTLSTLGLWGLVWIAVVALGGFSL